MCVFCSNVLLSAWSHNSHVRSMEIIVYRSLPERSLTKTVLILARAAAAHDRAVCVINHVGNPGCASSSGGDSEPVSRTGRLVCPSVTTRLRGSAGPPCLYRWSIRTVGPGPASNPAVYCAMGQLRDVMATSVNMGSLLSTTPHDQFASQMSGRFVWPLSTEYFHAGVRRAMNQ